MVCFWGVKFEIVPCGNVIVPLEKGVNTMGLPFEAEHPEAMASLAPTVNPFLTLSTYQIWSLSIGTLGLNKLYVKRIR